MPLTLASFAGGGQQNGPFATVVSAAQNVASGNSIVVGGRWLTTACTDNAGNTYIPLGHLIGNPVSNAGEGFDYWYCNNCIGNAALVVTLTFNSNHAQSLDTYTSIAVWNISGGPLILDQYLMSTGNSGSVMTYGPFAPRYPNSIICLTAIATSNLATFTSNAPLTQDGGTSLGGVQIAAASHLISSTIAGAQPLVMNATVSGTWEIGGPIFGAGPVPLPTKKRVERFGAAQFTGREYAYYITLERLL